MFRFAGDCFDNIIRDVTYEATSTDQGHSPSDAALDNEGAWCTSQLPPNEYLQVNLGNLYEVCGIVIRGFKNDSHDFFTTNYSLSFSKGRSAWSYLLDDNKSIKVNKSLFYIPLCNAFAWYSMEYPTGKLYFLDINECLKIQVASSIFHGTMYTTEERGITHVIHVFHEWNVGCRRINDFPVF